MDHVTGVLDKGTRNSMYIPYPKGVSNKEQSPSRMNEFTWSPKVCTTTPVWVMNNGLRPLFYILSGAR